MSKINFSGWGEKRFLRWLTKNYPDPGTRLVQVTLNAHRASGIFFFTMADTYLRCLCELAYEMRMNRDVLEDQGQLEILLQPARRRKKKQMSMKVTDPALAEKLREQSTKSPAERVAELEAKGLHWHVCPKCGSKRGGMWALPPTIIICEDCKARLVPQPPRTL